MTFRIEQKYKLDNKQYFILMNSLKKLGMKELHKGRKVNSLYFDNNRMQSFSDSQEGIVPRFKIRIRNYKDFNSKIFYELKISSPEGRFKQSKLINNRSFSRILKNGIYNSNYGMCYPKLYISYFRQYFSYKNIRVTFDSNISYRKFHVNEVKKEEHNAMEFKVPFDFPLDNLNTLFHLPNARFSKYSNACETLFSINDLC